MVVAGVAVGIIGGYLAGSGMLGPSRASASEPKLIEVRRALAAEVSEEKQVEVLRLFDRAVRRAK